MTATVFNSATDLYNHTVKMNEQLVVTSGGFDPLHVGHQRCIIESAEIAKKTGIRVRLAVIVNSDGFLLRKKGKAFMPENERMEIIAGIVGVDYVIPWDDGSQTVTGALSILQPLIFTKGGDRDAATNVPEFDLCEKIRTRVMFNVGGGKIQSSSALISAAKEF